MQPQSRLAASAAPAAPSPAFVLSSMLGATLAIGLTGWLTQVSGYPLQMAPFGASCVLAFGLPESPLAQPRSIIGGHLVATLVGLLVLHVVGNGWAAAALAVGLALALMQLTRTVHAPAGADPLVVLASGATADFLLTPVLAGSTTIVLVALLVNNARANVAAIRATGCDDASIACCRGARFPSPPTQVLVSSTGKLFRS